MAARHRRVSATTGSSGIVSFRFIEHLGKKCKRRRNPHVLAHLVKQAHPAWSWEADDLAAIQPGAVLLRYPGYSATQGDAVRAIGACTRLRAALRPLSGNASV